MSNLQLPGNPRYQPKLLIDHFGYDNLYRCVAEVEIATMEFLGEIKIIPKDDIAQLTPEIKEKLLAIKTTAVDEVERTITKHDIRAWVRLAQDILPSALRRWVHVPLTSYDVLDTARSLQFLRAHDEVVKKLTKEVMGHFVGLIRKYADVPQIGRTHGQHALPITVGFWLATVLGRILRNAISLDRAADNLVGKISGAVGAYNAQQGLGILEKCSMFSFEERVLGKLGLPAAPISTQILPPESLADYLFGCIKLTATFGQFGRDCRHLMRSEIAELCEPFEKGQVGSSTMAHKRNPITFENLEGMWIKNQAEFGKVSNTLISEHQRDLVGSSVARDFPIIVVNLVNQLNALLRPDKNGKNFIERITVDEKKCKENIAQSGDLILAEPLYIALQMAGYEGDAHELVNHKAMPLVKEYGSLFNATKAALNDPSIWNKIPTDIISVLVAPDKYVGLSAQKAHEIADEAEKYIEKISIRIHD